jgi:DNA-binding NtrC family response regulator
MNKILVVDASAAVRETIHLVLGGDFAVAQKASLEAVDFNEPGVDLLIVGVSSAVEESADLADIARRAYSPVLFLVDAQFSPAGAPQWRGIDYLVKPFNPYSLKEKIAGLLRDRPAESQASAVVSGRRLRYLDPPFFPPEVSKLARQYAETPFALLIVAEPGCGQEALARGIHGLRASPGGWLSVHPAEAARLGETLEAMQAHGSLTVYLREVDSLPAAAQASLLDALLAEEARSRELRPIANTRADLLEKVYRGEFLDSLYYRLGTLVLAIPPLRDRPEDIPLIADRLAEEYARNTNSKKIRFSPAALERLRNYLWFGNVDELEAVVYRTLALHSKDLIDAPDLLMSEKPLKPAERKSVRREEPAKPKTTLENPEVSENPHAASVWSNGYSRELKLIIGELAHEMKNPMVTVKTFSQLLGDRFDDPAFRVRFQETVNGDIQRMDDLLDALTAFSHFGPPQKEKVMIADALKRIEGDLQTDCARRETSFQWGAAGDDATAFVDKAQFLFAFKNILVAAAAQVKPKTDIRVDVEPGGHVAISYIGEAAGMGTLAAYLGAPQAAGPEEALPLRLMLANILLERNGGGVHMVHSEGERLRILAEVSAETSKGDEKKP